MAGEPSADCAAEVSASGEVRDSAVGNIRPPAGVELAARPGPALGGSVAAIRAGRSVSSAFSGGDGPACRELADLAGAPVFASREDRRSRFPFA